jgi:hypothetical protein
MDVLLKERIHALGLVREVDRELTQVRDVDTLGGQIKREFPELG